MAHPSVSPEIRQIFVAEKKTSIRPTLPSYHACIFAAVKGHRQLPHVRIEHRSAPANTGRLEENGCKGLILGQCHQYQKYPKMQV